MELRAKIQELQSEVNCMNDLRDFEDAESVRSGLSHVTSQPASLPPFRDPGGMLSRSVGMLSRNDSPPSILGRAWCIGKCFFSSPPGSSSSLYRGGFNPWISNVTEDISPHVTSERQIPDSLDASQDRQPEIHSTPKREDFQRIMEQTNKDCRFRNFTLTNSLHQQHLLVGR